MNGLQITCDSCHHSWRLDTADSVYLQLELASQPCPYCEAYTLGCHAGRDADLPLHPSRARPLRHSLRRAEAARTEY